jgi:GDP-mannose 6-dehydrogenase
MKISVIGLGYDLRIHDANVTPSRLMGADRDYIEGRLPHLNELLSGSADEVLEHAEVYVVGNTDPAVLSALDRAGDRMVIDLVSLPDARARRANPGYVGHGW